MDSLIYGLEHNARSLTTLNNTENVNFLVGTQQINGSNQIHLISLDERNKIHAKIFSHEEEIWKLTSSDNENLIASIFTSQPKGNETLSKKCKIMRIPDLQDDDEAKETHDFESVEVLKTEGFGSDMISAEFHPTSSELLACVMDKKVVVVNINEADQVKQEIPVKSRVNGGCWNGANQFVTLQERNICGYDTRESPNSSSWCIEDADSQMVRDIDINPNKAFHIVCGGDDGILKIFDIRKCKEPVFSTGGLHKHWIFSVSFNKFHDQLLLSSSSDGKFALTRALSCSSEIESGNEFNQSQEDGVLKIFSSEHDDSVYCVEWSYVDPWTFASLSYDGRLIINRVPKEYKFQILL